MSIKYISLKMQLTLFALAIFAGCCALALPSIPFPEDAKQYPRFIEFGDEDGVVRVIDLEEEPDMRVLQEIERNPANNLYLLFTRRNPTSSQTLVINNADSIRRSNFNPNVETVVIAHGWLSNQNTDLNPVIRDAYLARRDVNIIVIDWRRLAISNYVTAANGIPAVGRGLGQFIRFLCDVSGANLNRFHLVGFSLGAHLVGNAGRELNGRVARISALDPAGPLWVFSSDKVRSSDALYVEGIHTDGNTGTGLGLGSNVGDVDFYPNGGNNQPGCLLGICDHNRAWELFAATVSYNHIIGNQCSSNTQMMLDNCRGASLPMGNDQLSKQGSGMYRSNTGRRYPF